MSRDDYKFANVELNQIVTLYLYWQNATESSNDIIHLYALNIGKLRFCQLRFVFLVNSITFHLGAGFGKFSTIIMQPFKISHRPKTFIPTTASSTSTLNDQFEMSVHQLLANSINKLSAIVFDINRNNNNQLINQ